MTWDELIGECLALHNSHGWTPLQIAQSFKDDMMSKYIPNEVTEKHLTDIEAAIQIGLLTEGDTP